MKEKTVKSIAKVAEETGLSAYSLRYYEKMGLLSVPRTESGFRDYDDRSLRLIAAIKHFRAAGIPLSKIKAHFEAPDDEELSLRMLEESREALYEELKNLQKTLDFLDYKIKYTKNLIERKRS